MTRPLSPAPLALLALLAASCEDGGRTQIHVPVTAGIESSTVLLIASVPLAHVPKYWSYAPGAIVVVHVAGQLRPPVHEGTIE